MKTCFMKRAAAGYTLIELGISMIVFGLVLAGFFTAYNQYRHDQNIQITSTNSQQLSAKIRNFLLENGRYPCPAAADLPPTDKNYGIETDCRNGHGFPAGNALKDYGTITAAAGQTVDGLTVEESPIDATRLVARGMVPFRSLNMGEEFAYDGYGNRLNYAVTTSMTDADTYDRSKGGIRIVDESGGKATNEANPIHFLIYSSGPDGAGAYNKVGKLAAPCNTSHADGENCNTSSGAAEKQATYRSMHQSHGTVYFDDVVAFSSTMDETFWRVADNTRVNIQNVDAGKKVVVGNPATLPATPNGVKLDVNGTLMVDDGDTPNASTGKLMAQTYCDGSLANCMSAELIAGAMPEMDCADTAHKDSGYSGEFMTGVANGKVRCKNMPDMASCPAGKYMAGVGSDGQPICLAIPNAADVVPTTPACPATSITVCTQPVTLPGGVNADSHIVNWSDVPHHTDLKKDFDYGETWKCNATGANYTQWKWLKITSNGGSCTCTDASSSNNKYACYSSDAMNQGPSGGWNGFAIKATTTTCNWTTHTKNSSSTVDTTACICKPITAVNKGGSSGCQVRDWVCDDDKHGHYTAYYWPTVAACACTGTSQDQDATCPTGQQGKVKQYRTQTCDVHGVLSGWGTWTNYTPQPAGYGCTGCTPTTETEWRDCPSGQVGGPVKWTRDYQCSGGGVWTGWTQAASAQQPNPACVVPCTSHNPMSENIDVGCPVGQTGSHIMHHDWECPANNWGTLTEVSNSCHDPDPPPPACTPGTRYYDAACPPPYSGTQTHKINYICDASDNKVDDPATDSIYSSNCYTPHYSWAKPTGGGILTDTHGGVHAGATCTATQYANNATTACWEDGPVAGKFYQYSSCSCTLDPP